MTISASSDLMRRLPLPWPQRMYDGARRIDAMDTVRPLTVETDASRALLSPMSAEHVGPGCIDDERRLRWIVRTRACSARISTPRCAGSLRSRGRHRKTAKLARGTGQYRRRCGHHENSTPDHLHDSLLAGVFVAPCRSSARFHQREVRFAGAAVGAAPVLRNVLPCGARRDAVRRVAQGLVVDVCAEVALPLL